MGRAGACVVVGGLGEARLWLAGPLLKDNIHITVLQGNQKSLSKKIKKKKKCNMPHFFHPPRNTHNHNQRQRDSLIQTILHKSGKKTQLTY